MNEKENQSEKNIRKYQIITSNSLKEKFQLNRKKNFNQIISLIDVFTKECQKNSIKKKNEKNFLKIKGTSQCVKENYEMDISCCSFGCLKKNLIFREIFLKDFLNFLKISKIQNSEKIKVLLENGNLQIFYDTFSLKIPFHKIDLLQVIQLSEGKYLVSFQYKELPIFKERNNLFSFEDTSFLIDCTDLFLYVNSDFLEGLFKLNRIISFNFLTKNSYLKNNLLSNSDIIEIYKEKPFEVYYLILSIISNNKHFLLFEYTKEEIFSLLQENAFSVFLAYFFSVNVQASITLQALKNIYSQTENKNIYQTYHRTVSINPSEILYKISLEEINSRVFCMYDRDYFLKVFFNIPESFNFNKRILESFYKLISKGMRVHKRIYKVFSGSNNQLKEKSIWFFSSYKRIIEVNNKKIEEVVKTENIIKKLGFNFPSKIGKKIVRIGLNLSNVYSYKYIEYEYVEDIFHNEILITDGIGKLCYSLLINSLFSYCLSLNNKINKLSNLKDLEEFICKTLKVKSIPIALQIRIGGNKGVVCLYPFRSKINLEYLNNLLKKNKSYVNVNEKLHLRNSMKKYDSDLKYLDIVGFSKAIKLHMNTQIIVLLEEIEGRGIIFNNFLNNLLSIIDNFFPKESTNISRDINKKRKTHSAYKRNNKKTLKELVEVLRLTENNSNKLNEGEKMNIKSYDNIKYLNRFISLKDKFRIPMFGKLLMGVIDEFNILEADEVFVQLSCNHFDLFEKKNFDKKNCLDCKNIILGESDNLINLRNLENITLEGIKRKNYKNIKDIKKGLVYRNPLHSLEDIQICKFVYKKQFNHLRDVIVFSSKLLKNSDCTMFQKCSGGDLDGDYYSVIFDEGLTDLFEKNKKEKIIKENVKEEKGTKEENFEDFILRSFSSNRLGLLSSIYQRLQDRFHSNHSNCHFLIDKIEKELDSVKKIPPKYKFHDLNKLLKMIDRTDLLNSLEITRNMHEIDEMKVNTVLTEVFRKLETPYFLKSLRFDFLSSFNRYNIYAIEHKNVDHKKIEQIDNFYEEKFYDSGKVLNSINKVMHNLVDSLVLNYLVNKNDFSVLFAYQRFLQKKICKVFKKYLKDGEYKKNCECVSLMQIFNNSENIKNDKKNFTEKEKRKFINDFFFDTSEKEDLNEKENVLNSFNFFYYLLENISKKSKTEFLHKSDIESFSFEWPTKFFNEIEFFVVEMIKKGQCCLNIKKFDISKVEDSLDFFVSNFDKSKCGDKSKSEMEVFKFLLRKVLYLNRCDDLMGIFLLELVDGEINL